MANTYTQIHIHAVFAVQNRQSIIHDSWKDELYKYLTGIITNTGNKLLIINGVRGVSDKKSYFDLFNN